MVNVNELDQNQIINNSIEMLNSFVRDESIMAAKTVDEAYEAFKKYTSITKEKFLDFLRCSVPIFVTQESEDNFELSELELEGVVGGKINFGWAKNIYNGVKNKAKSAWTSAPGWVRGAVVGIAVGAAIGAVVGLGLATGGAAATALIAESGAAMAQFTATFAAFAVPAISTCAEMIGVMGGIVGILDNTSK